MIHSIVDLMMSSPIDIHGDQLTLKNHTVVELNCLQYLNNQQCIEQINLAEADNLIEFEQLRVGQKIHILFSLSHLNRNGFYLSFEDFFRRNKWKSPAGKFYLYKENVFSDNVSNCNYLSKYLSVLQLKSALEAIASDECSYHFADSQGLIVFHDKRYLVVPVDCALADFITLNFDDKKATKIIEVFQSDDSEKKNLFINEYIDYLTDISSRQRWCYLLQNIGELYDKCLISYQFYLSDFSSKKLKLEIDNAILDYSRKIQSVINDAQSKLIAIPVAFVLAATNIDFSSGITTKNGVVLFSLFVFSILIDIFLRNQYSALRMIKGNVNQYKNSLSVEQIQGNFQLLDSELKKQKSRLLLVRWIVWTIPILLSLIILLTGKSIFIFWSVIRFAESVVL